MTPSQIVVGQEYDSAAGADSPRRKVKGTYKAQLSNDSSGKKVHWQRTASEDTTVRGNRETGVDKLDDFAAWADHQV